MSTVPPGPPFPARRSGAGVLPVLALVVVALVAGLLVIAAEFAFHVARQTQISTRATTAGENVAIHSPFGNLNVDTDTVGAKFGIAVFPGAVPVGKDGPSAFGQGVEVNGRHYHSAHVHLQFGPHGLFVDAGEFASPAAPQAVLDFYRARLAPLGTIKEEHHREDGTPVTELRVTAGDNAHVVAVRAWQEGSRFVLVRVNQGSGGI